MGHRQGMIYMLFTPSTLIRLSAAGFAWRGISTSSMSPRGLRVRGVWTLAERNVDSTMSNNNPLMYCPPSPLMYIRVCRC